MSNDIPDDASLRRLYQQFCENNSRVAGTELVNTCSDRLLVCVKTCMRKRGFIWYDHEAAEDCVQDTWRKLWEHCGKQLQEGSFISFMCTIARNTGIDHLRKQRPTIELGDGDIDDTDGLPVDEQDKPDNLCQQQEQHRILKEAIQELPEEQCQALTLQVWEDFSIDEISEYTDANRETVRSRLRYAKQFLKNKFRNFEEAFG